MDIKKYFTIPINCPSCSSILIYSGEYLMCDNYDCHARIKGRISNWISELGIKEWGDIQGVPPLIGCLENKKTFECHPFVDQICNKILEII